MLFTKRQQLKKHHKTHAIVFRSICFIQANKPYDQCGSGLNLFFFFLMLESNPILQTLNTFVYTSPLFWRFNIYSTMYFLSCRVKNVKFHLMHVPATHVKTKECVTQKMMPAASCEYYGNLCHFIFCSIKCFSLKALLQGPMIGNEHSISGQCKHAPDQPTNEQTQLQGLCRNKKGWAANIIQTTGYNIVWRSFPQ